MGISEPQQVVVPVSVPQPPASPAVQKVLNMGRWDTGGGDDADNIDFGFGSFGANDIVQQVVNNKETTTTAAAGVSPARPPPGLSIGGMPPMPASAVMGHELENKLESASLNAKNEQAPAQGQSQQTSNTSSTAQTSLPSGITQQSYNQQQQLQQQQQQQQQAMPGMYNYTPTATGGGFAGMQPVLAGMPQQQQQPGKPQGSLQHQGLYSAQAPPGVQSSAINAKRGVDSTSGTSAGDNTSAGAGVPPGMPGAIPYANPALHYGAQQAAAAQHQFYAMQGHQQQQGIGYNYGYAGHAQQFGGAVQGGFGYPQQVMGQNQGYGASHYDDQGHQQGNSHHSGSGGYQNKNGGGGGGGGGYRGRNAHNNSNNNQYQNHYNPQQHGGAHSGFQDDDHQKGRK